MTALRTALLLAALTLATAAMPACAGPGNSAPQAPAAQPDAQTQAEAGGPVTSAEREPTAADNTAAEQAAAREAAVAQLASQKAAEEKAATELHAEAERAAAAAQMRREKEAAEAAALAESAKAASEQRAAQAAALEATKGKTAEQVAAQNAAALQLAAKPAQAAPAAPTAPAADVAGLVAEIQTSKGTLVLEFFPDVAPKHVQNFIDLARRGFYDGLTFHRIIPGFMIQTGDPRGDGTGGAEHTLAAEFNARPHKRGTLSMARQSHPDSASSQFFICHEENAGYDLSKLDGRYTVFGQLVRGYDVLDSIAAVGSPSGEPKEKVTMLKVIIRTRQDSDHEPGA